MDRLSRRFASFANPDQLFFLEQQSDGDMILETWQRDAPSNAIRLRSWAGGGRNLLLHKLFFDFLISAKDPAAGGDTIPSDHKVFSFYCDDNPGSNLTLAIAAKAIGVQTNCHDAEANRAAGGYLNMQCNGPMVWLPAALAPKVHKALGRALVDGKMPTAFRDRGVHLR